MTLAAGLLADDLDPLDSVEGPAAFCAISDDGVAGVIWRRAPPAHVQHWIDHLPIDALPSARVVLRSDDIRFIATRIIEGATQSSLDEARWLADDVAMIGAAFAKAMAAPYLRLRFDVVTDEGCSKFHIDAVRARLICSYRGAGAQYGVARSGETPARVFTAPTGAVLVLRGTQWGGSSHTLSPSLRHRSPPTAQASKPRLVLVLDPLVDPQADEGRGLRIA